MHKSDGDLQSEKWRDTHSVTERSRERDEERGDILREKRCTERTEQDVVGDEEREERY